MCILSKVMWRRFVQIQNDPKNDLKKQIKSKKQKYYDSPDSSDSSDSK